ncbi:exodeoxyribonuclease VII large subunit [Eubacteriaceae bacterium ES3]|nr:exodeoxyribonuclease VII large subunit [Eubacteriaceae bacterium ES3]
MNTKALSVSDVNQYIKTLLETNSLLKNLLIQGELSNVRKSAAGHLYFSLKDQKSKLDCVMFKNAAGKLKFLPKEGQQVSLRGAIGLYLPSGQYQITVRTMEPKGQGDLYQAYLMLKDELEAKGFFSQAAKKELPEAIGRVGIVTSPTGAALQDMITIIKRRNPLMDIVVYPSLVQGPEAYKTIISGIRAFNTIQNVDVIVLARGGGSIEDLWAFNHEELAEAIYESQLPVISAVGHEIDFTIADFVADLRAPTPSGAAELVAEDQHTLIQRMIELKNRMTTSMVRQLEAHSLAVGEMNKRINRYKPINRIEDLRLRIDVTEKQIRSLVNRHLSQERILLDQYRLRIEAMNPENILKKGYILVEDENRKIVSSVKQIKPGQKLKMRLSDGRSSVEVLEVENKNGSKKN